MTRRHPDDALISNPMTRRHPDEALVRNPKDTAPARGRPGQQSPRHGATQTTPCSPIRMTRRHPDHVLLSNSQDTAPPRGRAAQQSPWHSATHATRPPAIPMAQRHPRDTPSSNPHGTAAPTRPAQQQSPWHSAKHATRATRPTPIVTAAFHGTAPHTRHARRSLPQRSKKRPLQAHIRKSTDSLRLPRFRNAQRAPAHAICRTGPRKPAILATAHDSLRLPRGSTVQCLPERINASEVPHLPRETQVAARKITRVCDTPGTQSPRQSAASMPAACPRHTSQHARSPQPATRNARWQCVYKTRPEPNPHGTAPRHTRGTPAAHLQHARSPQPATRNDAQVAPSPTPATRHARNARGATGRAVLRAGFPHRATVSKTSSRPPRRLNRRI